MSRRDSRARADRSSARVDLPRPPSPTISRPTPSSPSTAACMVIRPCRCAKPSIIQRKGTAIACDKCFDRRTHTSARPDSVGNRHAACAAKKIGSPLVVGPSGHDPLAKSGAHHLSRGLFTPQRSRDFDRKVDTRRASGTSFEGAIARTDGNTSKKSASSIAPCNVSSIIRVTSSVTWPEASDSSKPSTTLRKMLDSRQTR